MNFIPSDSPATVFLTDRTRLHGGSIATTRHVVIIPSYNTGARLFDTVATIRGQDWPVWVVIDGSTDGTGDELARIAANDPDLRVCVLPRNRGKGAAVLHGLRLAHARGFTHAVTVDADGQHSAEHIESLISLSDEYPEAMILGVPVFDASAPAIRIAGHLLANFCSDLATLWSGIGDSLFGFRVYPIAPLLRTFDDTRWMRRFDFDSEAAIRLAWQGVPPINVPTPVRYFRREDGGVSHFNYLRDNVLLLLMYTRLFAELLPNMPHLLLRRFKSFHR
ncbi:MAG TPA: glycosyltransferase family 2 protein [Acetobacteraceae bacterium]|jgi:glycosyltransferase involved in cell wall biosynthesis|nr:glycosyltransferase family 2 protein [Acetobacteraceae bacterium]